MTDINVRSELLILSALKFRPMHGYGIIAELYRSSGRVFDLPEGTVYPLLRSLERRGLISGEQALVDSRMRRVYSLTPAGATAFDDLRAAWRRHAQAVESEVTRGMPPSLKPL